MTVSGLTVMQVADASNNGKGRDTAARVTEPKAGSRMSRLSQWIGGGGSTPVAPTPRESADGHADRELFARIGAFLDRHALEPSVAHYRIARAYVLRQDDRLVGGIDTQVREHGAIDAAFLQTLIQPEPGDPLSPERIAGMADALAARLAETEHMFSQSHASVRDYERALTIEADTASSDPNGMVKRLLALTTEAIARNRELADRLKETHRVTSQLRSNLQEARRAADEDHLTGLPNRRCFDARLRDLTGQVNDGTRCVALCDIDNFKAINDRHGHDTGDRVLKLIARHLTTELGASVLVARHGGEEFACLFEGRTPDEALMLLDDALGTLGARVLVNQASGDGIGRLTFSGGIALLGSDAAVAMRAADAALYAAKRAGKNRIMISEG